MIETLITAIQPLDTGAMETCQVRIDNLTKPLGSLHALEHLAIKIAGILRNPRPREIKKAVLVFAADHGVAAEQVSAFPATVSAQMANNILAGGAAINALAEHADASLFLINMGLLTPLPDHPALRSYPQGLQTHNIRYGPAMSRNQARQAMERGAKVVLDLIKEQNIAAFALGDLGIGNTTASAALVAALTGHPPLRITGRGTGIDDATFARKVLCIERALDINQPVVSDPLDVLAKLGGFEIAALSGAIIAAASQGRIVVLDGMITAAAALVAARLTPKVIPYLIGSHYSLEPAQRIVLENIGIPAYLHLDMRLGEGTGAALGLTLLDASLHMLNDMKTFGEAAVAVAEDGPGALKQNHTIR